jgi:hypothetical protein
MLLRRHGKRLGTRRQQQVVALGRLGWTLRRIEREIGVRRETASNYLKSPAFRSAGAGDQEKGRENRPFPGRCPPFPRRHGRRHPRARPKRAPVSPIEIALKPR